MLGDKVKRLLKRTFVKDEGMFDYHPNGRKRREAKWIDKAAGIKSEIWWDDCGRKETESILTSHGDYHGLQTEWHENGRKKVEGVYSFNEKDGLWTEWYESGRKKKEEFYEDDEVKDVKTWDENGNET